MISLAIAFIELTFCPFWLEIGAELLQILNCANTIASIRKVRVTLVSLRSLVITPAHTKVREYSVDYSGDNTKNSNSANVN